jgi:hypothetical protein
MGEEAVMRLRNKIAAALLALAAIPGAAYAASIGGVWYAVQYDYSEFFAASDGKKFQVILAGNPFPELDQATVARELLPLMQAAKPRPALTFTYERPPEPPRPDYRLVLVADPADDLNSDTVCRGTARFRGHQPGQFYVYAIYCRNDMTMSQTTAKTPATGPTDPRIAELFRELFMVVFSDSPALRPHSGGMQRF